MKIIATTAGLLCLATFAQADIAATFSEGAPKDRFTFENTASCALPALSLTLDLAQSAGKLVFDVTDAGAGVEVFQPFELVSGAKTLTNTLSVADGDTALTLELNGLPPKGQVAFTIDVDDTLGAREITVNSAEISGATLRASVASTSYTAQFDGTSAQLELPCAS